MKIPLDKSRLPASVSYFKGTSSIEVDKDDLFKLGIFKQEIPPDHVGENEYLYLMSKVPAYTQIYNDFISIDGDSIVNTSKDDRMMKDISEIVGIALGIKVTIEAFGIRQERITKVPPPSTKQKYLDYKFIYNGQSFELETKGTTSENVRRPVNDIAAKKAAPGNAHFQFGTVSVLTKPKCKHHSIIHICDDPPEDFTDSMPDDNTPLHYISALGYLLDNKYYNRLAKTILLGEEPKKDLSYIKNRFFGEYTFDGSTYYGEFFDYRLNIENIQKAASGKEKSVEQVFRKVTKAQGKKKLFIGVHSSVVDLLLKEKGLNTILDLQFEREKRSEESGTEILRDSDGIIVVLSLGEIDKQIEEQFTEKEVKRRLGCFVRFTNHEPTRCGAPCRSRDKLGKPCEIKTNRGACHFHR